MRRFLVTVLLLFSSCSSAWAFCRSIPTLPQPPQIFAFAAVGTDNVSHIYLGNLATRGTQQLTSSSVCADVAPEWSFDGTQIAFERDCTNDHEVYKMNADGSNLTQVTTSTLAFVPTWTPGGQIVYMNEVFQVGPVFCTNSYNVPCTDLRLINADGSGDTELLASSYTNGSAVSSINISPHVTPDGATVLFACGPYGSGAWGGPGIQLCSIPLATGNVTQVPTLLSTITSAVSSDPNIGLTKVNGQFPVVFDSTRVNGDLNVFRMDVNGLNVLQRTSFAEPIEGQDAGFSVDMTQIIFEHDTSGSSAEIWVMNADGSNQADTGIACTLNGCKPRFQP